MNPQLSYAQKKGMKLGLSQAQVSHRNFGFHTIHAIESDMGNGIGLQQAFEKFENLNYAQVEAMQELGLSRIQASSANFDYHTISAISDIRKVSKELSNSQAFELVKGKGNLEVRRFVSQYVASKRKANKPLNEMSLIRVIVRPGRGFGHQRAAITLMQKLRELGFKGIFDIQCEDKLNAQLRSSETGKTYTNCTPLVSKKLKSMLPDFESSIPDKDEVRSIPGIGGIKIFSLPHDKKAYQFEGSADLAVCAAHDSILKGELAQKFNASSYIQLQPTDWHQGFCFVITQEGVHQKLPESSETRLSSAATSELLDISVVEKSTIEDKILRIAGGNINSQLIYGLYPSMTFDIKSDRFKLKESGHLDPATEMRLIVEANMRLGIKYQKPSILFLPQEIALNHKFQREVMAGRDNIHFVDVTKTDIDLQRYKPEDVIVAYTGRLKQPIFDHLMLRGTTLPPVIEGCNAIESCESTGKPCIHGSGKHQRLKEYDVSRKDKQKLHLQASFCLETGSEEHLPQLILYMDECLSKNSETLQYHDQRKKAYFKRPDATELALKTLGIKYEMPLQQQRAGNGSFDIAMLAVSPTSSGRATGITYSQGNKRFLKKGEVSDSGRQSKRIKK